MQHFEWNTVDFMTCLIAFACIVFMAWVMRRGYAPKEADNKKRGRKCVK